MGCRFLSMMISLLLAGCALTSRPPACHGPLQPINGQIAEKSDGPA